MADRRSAIKSSDVRGEKHVSFRSPVMTNRSITPLGERMTVFDDPRSPMSLPKQPVQRSTPQQQRNNYGTPVPQKQQQQQRPPSKRPHNPGNMGSTPGKRSMSSSDSFSLANAASLEETIVRSNLAVRSVKERLDAASNEIPSLFEAATETLYLTAELVFGLQKLDRAMYEYSKREKQTIDSLTRFMKVAQDDEAKVMAFDEIDEALNNIEEQFESDTELLNSSF